MTVHQGLPQPPPSWDSNVIQSHVFDCEDWFPAGGWLACVTQRQSSADGRGAVRQGGGQGAGGEHPHTREAEQSAGSVRQEVWPGQKLAGFPSLLPPLPTPSSAQARDLLLGPLQCPMHFSSSFSLPLILSRRLQGQPHSGLHDRSLFFSNQVVAW